MTRTEAITTILVALISAGLLSYLKDIIKAIKSWWAKRSAPAPEARDSIHVAAADQSLLVVAKARDELEEDNRRLRVMLAEERTRREEDRVRAEAREAAYRREITELESRVRAVLADLEALRERHSG